MTSDTILLGAAGPAAQHLNLRRANRHGLITGATGTGKTVTLRVMAEGFAERGVPVLLTDVKGDLAAISRPGEPVPAFAARAEQIGLHDYRRRGYPTRYWDVLGKRGHPVRATVSDLGPLLLARLLGLNDTQEGVLAMAFAVADDQGLALLDLKDLRAMLNFLAAHAAELAADYGGVSKASLGAIQRRLLGLEREGGSAFFGEPALDVRDLMARDGAGEAPINVLDARDLMAQPKLYACVLLWLLSELFEELPEIGDPERPVLAVFFDEAHLMFERAPGALLEKVEQAVRLIRSKGVGLYFVTQTPADIPEAVLGQLGNRVQHALRAYTPRERKAVRAAAQAFRANPAFDAEQVIGELGVGEALVSTLDAKGVPGMVERTLIRPPSSRTGTLPDAERRSLVAAGEFAGRYDTPLDRESAHEILQARAARREQAAASPQARGPVRATRGGGARGRSRQGLVETLAKSLARGIGSSLGRRLVRGLLGSLSRR